MSRTADHPVPVCRSDQRFVSLPMADRCGWMCLQVLHEDISVTIYRAPGRASGSITLNQLNGFALISEARTVSIPAGESRIRFAGVADGIESASAILTGLPADLIERIVTHRC